MIVLTARKLKAALEFANPDGPRDPDQLDTEISIRFMAGPRDMDTGKRCASGLYAWFTEYPEEGCIPLFDAPEMPARLKRPPSNELHPELGTQNSDLAEHAVAQLAARAHLHAQYDKYELAYLEESPDAIRLVADYHDFQQSAADATEIGTTGDCTRRKELLDLAKRIEASW